eukprot:SAG31_NODE_744_length_12415_cov_74.120900_9_plen_70_part_00
MPHGSCYEVVCTVLNLVRMQGGGGGHPPPAELAPTVPAPERVRILTKFTEFMYLPEVLNLVGTRTIKYI